MTIQERFEDWIDSPDGRFIEDWVRSRALAMVEGGWRHYAIGALWEAARYSRDVKVGPNSGFKLNDHFRSRLARRVMASEPRLDGFFEIRNLREAGAHVEQPIAAVIRQPAVLWRCFRCQTERSGTVNPTLDPELGYARCAVCKKPTLHKAVR